MIFSKRRTTTPDSTTSRFPVEPSWPAPGEYMITRPIMDYHYDAMSTVVVGAAVSNVPTNGFMRGNIIRQYQPSIHPPMLGYFTYNPSDPTTWHQSQH